MKNWFDSYSMLVKSTPFEIEKKHGVIIGFNVNIDKIIAVNPLIVSKIIMSDIISKIELKKELPLYIENNIDFLSWLFHSIEFEKADEIVTNSKSLIDWIENTFDIKDIRIGGQAGIIANLYSRLGLKPVLLSLPVQTVELTNLLHQNILTVLKDDSGYSVDKISNIKNTVGKPISHYVFEFAKGTYDVGKHTIECKRDNRFILSYDEINTQLRFNEGFVDYCDNFISEYSLAIVSGFHLIHQKLNSFSSFYDIIEPVEKMFKKWKNLNPSLCLHLEIASTKDKELRKTIINNLFPVVDSIGLNEQELTSFIEVINPEIAQQMQESKDSVLVFKALYMILENYPNLRIHFHYFGYFLILSAPIEQEMTLIRKQGLLLSSLIAAIKATGTEITSLNQIQNVSLNITEEGLKSLEHLHEYLINQYPTDDNLYVNGFFNSPFFSLVGIPTIIVKNPKTTVGLGDHISSISIIYEIQ